MLFANIVDIIVAWWERHLTLDQKIASSSLVEVDESSGNLLFNLVIF